MNDGVSCGVPHRSHQKVSVAIRNPEPTPIAICAHIGEGDPVDNTQAANNKMPVGTFITIANTIIRPIFIGTILLVTPGNGPG